MTMVIRREDSRREPPYRRAASAPEIELTVGPDGKVADWRVVKGVPLLNEAARDAVQKLGFRDHRVQRRYFSRESRRANGRAIKT